jgi:hypothetical protein
MKPTTAPNPGFWNWLRTTPGRPGELPGSPLVTLRLEPFCREHGGKTALQSCLSRGPLLGAQDSGLELTAADPRVLNQWVRQALERYRDLQVRGLTSTPTPAVTEYVLCEADEPRATLQWKDGVGQLLSHPTPDSPEDVQVRWSEMIDHLAQADILAALVNCPPAGASADLARFEQELQLQAAYLREALKRRPAARPAALALVINKIDTCFASAREARDALTDERLRTALARLVRLAEGSTKVGMAAIIPVSAFGFGTTVSAAASSNGRDPVSTTRGASPLSEGETEWLLKPDTTPQPFNLTGMVWWCLMAGLLLQPADGRQQELARLARMLADDLESMDAWFVPLRCKEPPTV